MANPVVIHPARFHPSARFARDARLCAPVYRYPKAGLLARNQKVTIAADLLFNEVKPRHIRKCLAMSGRQFKVAKRLAKSFNANIEDNG